jgi:hypothetical protein
MPMTNNSQPAAARYAFDFINTSSPSQFCQARRYSKDAYGETLNITDSSGCKLILIVALPCFCGVNFS